MVFEKYKIETTTKDNNVRVRFFSPMEPWEWNNLRKEVVRMLKKGFLQWEFILEELNFATSVDIGMWVSCNGTINSYSGIVQFIVQQNSTVHKTIIFTKLDKVLSISLTGGETRKPQ